MYSAEVRQKALDMLDEGYSASEVARRMGGKPSTAIILRWAKGDVPVGKRNYTRLYSLEEKLAAVRRLDAGEEYHAVAADVGCVPTTLLTWRKIRDQQGEQALATRLDRWAPQNVKRG